MGNFTEKLIFTILGALTAVIVALALFHEPLSPNDRIPASTKTPIEPEPIYYYFFD